MRGLLRCRTQTARRSVSVPDERILEETMGWKEHGKIMEMEVMGKRKAGSREKGTDVAAEQQRRHDGR